MIAPVALFCFRRLSHLKNTIDRLQQNELAMQTPLIVYSDGPKKGEDVEKVREIRSYLKTIDGFASVTVHERSTNFGLKRSIIEGVTEVLNKYERVIVVEDDLLTSRYFLRYMNDSLDIYADNEKVISIHAYIYPVRKKLPALFFLRGADCWGWATWKRGWDLLETDGTKLLNEIKNVDRQGRFDFYGTYPYTRMLEDQIAGRNDSWAILWYASAFLKGKLTLYPGTSLVQNIGNDHSGTHNPDTSIFDVALADEPVSFDVKDLPKLEDNDIAARNIADYFSRTRSISFRLKSKLRRLFGKR